MIYTKTFLPLLLVSTAMFVGCERSPSDEHAAPTGSSVKIVSTSPDTAEPLQVGELVKLHIEVAYTLSTSSGTLGLVVQASDNSSLAQDMEVVNKGSGTIQFDTEFLVPNTKAIQVFTPLSAQSQSSTSTVDMWAFKVVSK